MPTTLLEMLQDKYPGQYPNSLRRTMQRRVREWKLQYGAEQEVMFRQLHQPGLRALSDFTELKGVVVTIQEKLLAHKLYHFRLEWSHWSWMRVVLGGESFSALAEGLQEALGQLGGVPTEHKTDSLRAAWKHQGEDARRKIHDVHVCTPSPLTEEALKRIGELYDIEADIRGAPAEKRRAERQLKTKPLLTSLESWLREKMKTLSRHSELAKAFAYALNQWSALTYYAEDGWAEADNNIAENALRMVSLGRKNFLFFGSDHGGERGALLYSLLGTCKLNGIDPERYLHHVLDVIADWPVNRVSELLPWRIVLPTE
jgi:hypothetical protein